MRREIIVQVLKATCAAVIFALIYALVFTFIVHVAALSSSVIKPVNQVFKIICLASGGLIFIKGEKGLVKGALLGLFYTVTTLLLFGAIGGSVVVTYKFAFELLICIAAGAIAGVIAVNLKKSAIE